MSSQDMAYWAKAAAVPAVLQEERAEPKPTATPFLDRLAHMQDKGMIVPKKQTRTRQACPICGKWGCLGAELA